ncbi:glutathionylspermidine synthase family protein [Qipengyuania sp. 6B39]|uniref:glutathionylspermidine synthase family protein n=1 Tax=Qipengyuania proteolytica TaxID=2867239 RepID=UPI001C89FD18|nr:glutathionylspermidine synthase family protein [Qipengyuania proteolytica]MBX7495550.1 glutathionylspermidine synthase family protein [Qipengyuania proteolytica]
MLRKEIMPRQDWEAIAQENGFIFHHVDGEIYWDERACWQFTLEEVESKIEDPSTELYALCLQLVDEACARQETMELLAIPEGMRDVVADSWRIGEPSLYGRFDFAYDGTGPAKLLEFNADTPTSIYETAYFQWLWLADMVAAGEFPEDADQFNRLHEALIERFAAIVEPGGLLHFSGVADHVEDRATVAYLEDCAGQAGLETAFVDIDHIGLTDDGRFVDPQGHEIAALFKLYPWEDMMREDFAAHVAGSQTRFIEPAWKALLSNKAMLPLLWERNEGHPNLLPAYFEHSDKGRQLAAGPHVRKPYFSREGADIALFDGTGRHSGPQQGYGAEGAIVQAYAPLARSGENHAVIGSWIVGDEAVAMSIREDASPITRDLARFLPHVILG